MCLAKQGTVVSAKNGKALIDYSGEQKEAIAKDIKVEKGDKVLVQFGVVIEKVS